MISNLPIIQGTKIKLVILTGGFSLKNATGGFCYANGLMTPMFYPIEGEYNDYGMIEEIEQDWNYNLITSLFKKSFTRIEVEGKEMTEFTLEDILEGIERGSLKVLKNKESYGNGIGNPDTELTKSTLSFAMIRMDVWDEICKNYVGEFWNDNQEEVDKGQYNISVNTYCSRRVEAMSKHMVKLKEIRATGDAIAEMKFSMIEMRDSNFFKEDRIVKTNHVYGNLYECEGADTEGMVKAWTELLIINSFLEDTRKSWMVQQGKGSQSQEWLQYKLLNKIIDKICDKEMEDYEE